MSYKLATVQLKTLLTNNDLNKGVMKAPVVSWHWLRLGRWQDNASYSGTKVKWTWCTTTSILLDVFSLFHRLFKQYRIKNIWSPPGIEPRTACIAHKRSATQLQQPPVNKHSNSVFILSRGTAMLHSNSVFILSRGTAMLQSHSQQTNKISLFSKFLIICWIFFLI